MTREQAEAVFRECNRERIHKHRALKVCLVAAAIMESHGFTGAEMSDFRRSPEGRKIEGKFWSLVRKVQEGASDAD